jgi:hypothetical protein
MGPFKRTRPAPSSDADADLRVRDVSYRRLGHALATVVVTLESAPPGDVRLEARGDARSSTLHPMMVTHEAPGTKAAAHRLWFVTDLSTVMFGDCEFLLLHGDAEVPVPEPAACASWTPDDPDADPPVAPEVLAEGELRAAVAALEERCRAAERANAELTADSRRMGEVVAATLAEVQHEREQLLDLLARTSTDLEREAEQQPRPAADPTALDDPNQGFLARLSAARGAASD